MVSHVVSPSPLAGLPSVSPHQAIIRSQTSFQTWSNTPAITRRLYVKHLRRLIVQRQLEIARTVAEETGKPITEIISQEITAALEMLSCFEKAYPRWLRPHRSRYWRPGFWTKSCSVHFEPLGVIGVIGPATYPFSLPLIQACAAILCGNCVVLKPSERCPRTGDLMRHLFKQAGFPEGVVEVIEGAGETVEELISHASVRKIIFTGSYVIGTRIAELCGRHFKPCVLELGGSGAGIVCEDADLALAAKGIAWSAFYANGLSCVGTKRVFVHQSVAEKFRLELLKEVGRISRGDPHDPSTFVGNTRVAADLSNLRATVADAFKRGARLWTSAGESTDIASFNFNQPAVLFDDADSTHGSAGSDWASQDYEVVGPLLLVRQVSSLDQGVRQANASPYGLGASVWSKDHKKACEVARQLHAGIVWINDSSAGQPQFPWGGLKSSGWGRLFSKEALGELTNLKVISVDHRRTSLPKMWWFPYTREKFETFLAVNEVTYGAPSLKSLGRSASALWRFVRSINRQH